jgi:hypothetical protein
MRSVARFVFRLLSALYLLGALAAFFAAGIAVFTINDRASASGTNLTEASFDVIFRGHMQIADVLFFVALLLVVAAFVGGLDRRARGAAIVLLVLDIVQATLAVTGGPGVRALHPVVGVLIVGVATVVVATWAPSGLGLSLRPHQTAPPRTPEETPGDTTTR